MHFSNFGTIIEFEIFIYDQHVKAAFDEGSKARRHVAHPL